MKVLFGATIAVGLGAMGLASGCSAEPATSANTSTASPATRTLAGTQQVTLKAADGVTVYGTYYPAARPKALILLFHQAGSSSAEYATIAPRLAEAGYSALAIDQRSGGALFGPNRTATALDDATAKRLEGDAGYLMALPDLQAALDWAEARKLPTIAWGSSYSSSLAFLLAAANPGKVRAVLAFSPGEYFSDPMIVRRAAAKLAVPVFVTTSGKPDEIARARPVFDAVPGADNVVYVPRNGVHGSSTLILARNPKGAAENWEAVMAFLRNVLA